MEIIGSTQHTQIDEHSDTVTERHTKKHKNLQTHRHMERDAETGGKTHIEDHTNSVIKKTAR